MVGSVSLAPVVIHGMRFENTISPTLYLSTAPSLLYFASSSSWTSSSVRFLHDHPTEEEGGAERERSAALVPPLPLPTAAATGSWLL